MKSDKLKLAGLSQHWVHTGSESQQRPWISVFIEGGGTYAHFRFTVGESWPLTEFSLNDAVSAKATGTENPSRSRICRRENAALLGL